MNLRMIFYSLGKTSLALAALLVLPMITSAVTQDGCVWAFVFTISIAVAIGVALMLIFKPRHTAMFSREGFVLVSLVWIYFSLVGALPFVISGAIPNYIDAFFETVSGVTTTGASILTGDQIESFPKGLLFSVVLPTGWAVWVSSCLLWCLPPARKTAVCTYFVRKCPAQL